MYLNHSRQIDSTMEVLTKVIRESKDAIEVILRATTAEGKQKKSSTDYLHKTVKHVSQYILDLKEEQNNQLTEFF